MSRNFFEEQEGGNFLALKEEISQCIRRDVEIFLQLTVKCLFAWNYILVHGK